MIQTYQNLSQCFPKLNIAKLKVIAKRWVEYNAEIPINRIVLYTCSSKDQKRIGETKRKYAVAFEILKKHEYKRYDMNLQKLHDYHDAVEEAAKRGETLTPDPIDEFIHDTEYYETIKPENPFLSFMTKDFEDVYWETPKKMKKEWELIPIWLNKESVFMELPSYVRIPTSDHL